MHLSQAISRVGDMLEQPEEVDQDQVEEEGIDQEIRPGNGSNIGSEAFGDSNQILVPERSMCICIYIYIYA
jgi:hypothetical protein